MLFLFRTGKKKKSSDLFWPVIQGYLNFHDSVNADKTSCFAWNVRRKSVIQQVQLSGWFLIIYYNI